MKRIDALASDDPERLSGLSGRALDRALDPELQRLVEQAAAQLEAPISLVSLVLKRTQFFRAHVGLPADLQTTQGTDRDASFCQFVVRDGRIFEVSDAELDPRVPRELVERYGIRAYLGEPIRVGGGVVGSLCAIDTRPREFTPQQLAALAALATSVGARIEQLAAPTVSSELLGHATAPLFAELRNLLSPLRANLQFASVALADLGVLKALLALPPTEWATTPAAGAVGGAVLAVDDLGALLAETMQVTRQLSEQIFALERTLSGPRQGCTLDELIAGASQLAHHHTKLVGGVSWPPARPTHALGVSRVVGVAALSAALSLLSDALREEGLAGPLQAAVVDGPGAVALSLSASALSAGAVQRTAAELRLLIGSEPRVEVRFAGAGLELRLLRQS